ncbi:MAG: hypothetical protein PW789_18790 [Edaphobacter sp.]|uniref:hypothetical protein n=1 Tax=Edaphobacter sp. TaxID=1934404 RepID=UPI0023824EB5|nr:hypothetical protein [Edaphobacter sp.]MDE1178627.1 hypothetical protein [Edaphobacter sp.]
MRISLEAYYWTYPILLFVVTAFLARMLYLASEPAGKPSSGDRPSVEAWVGRLLIAGLVIVSAGYLGVTLLTQDYLSSRTQLVDMVLIKLGFGLMLLGVLFSFDLLVLATLKKGSRMRHARSLEPRYARSSELR